MEKFPQQLENTVDYPKIDALKPGIPFSRGLLWWAKQKDSVVSETPITSTMPGFSVEDFVRVEAWREYLRFVKMEQYELEKRRKRSPKKAEEWLREKHELEKERGRSLAELYFSEGMMVKYREKVEEAIGFLRNRN